MKHIDSGQRVILVLAATLLTGPAASPARAQGAPPPLPPAVPAVRLRLPQPGEFNVLMIVLDDLGTDHLPIYTADAGPPYYCASTQLDAVRTPFLNDLRTEGVLFTRCYVNTTCSPTRAALMTGRYGRRTGIGHAINPGDTVGTTLPLSEVCLPELLRALNPTYKRGAFGKWHLAPYFDDDCHPGDSGFELYEGMKANPESHFDWRKVTATGGASGCTGSSSQDIPGMSGLTPDESFWDASVTTQDALAWITAQGAAPFFAYVAYSPPHAPQEVPPYSTLSPATQARLAYSEYDAGAEPRDGRLSDARMIHRAMIEGVDHEIGDLLAGISAAVLARTMVIIVGDNGTLSDMINDPALSSHGKRTLFELGTRVPLLVTGPLVAASAMGGTCRNLVGAVDLWRTAANITGLSNVAIDAYMSGTTIDSVSFLTAIQQPASSPTRAFAYSEAFKNGLPLAATGYQRGMIDGVYRYIRRVDDAGNPTEVFYNNPSDPCEFVDLLDPSHTLTGPETTALNALIAALNAL